MRRDLMGGHRRYAAQRRVSEISFAFDSRLYLSPPLTLKIIHDRENRRSSIRGNFWKRGWTISNNRQDSYTYPYTRRTESIARPRSINLLACNGISRTVARLSSDWILIVPCLQGDWTSWCKFNPRVACLRACQGKFNNRNIVVVVVVVVG